MRILIIHNEYQQRSGEHVAVQRQIRLLRDRGHEVILFLRDSNELRQISAAAKAAAFYSTLYSAQTACAIRRLLNERRPDIAHVHNVFPLISPTVYRTLSNARIPVVQTIHNFRLLCACGLLFRNGRPCELCATGRVWPAARYRCLRNNAAISFIYALSIHLHRRLGTFRLIDKFITLNVFVSNKLIHYGIARADNTTVIPNFTELPDNPPSSPAAPRTVLSIGRLSEEKGLRLLLKAARLIPHIKIIIAGTGPQEAQLREQVQATCLTNVEFTGPIYGQQKTTAIYDSAAVVFTADWYENLPFSLLEAMAHRRIPIAPDQGSFASIIKDGTDGLLYEPGNPAALADAINSVVNHAALRSDIETRARQKAATCYSSDIHYAELMRTYEACRT